jgi:class 3 adenylate cyclase
LLGLGRYREAARAAMVARDAARAAGALDEEGRSLDMLGMARVGTGRLSTGIAALIEAVTIARDHDPGEAHIVGCYNLAYHLLLADRPIDAIAWARQGSDAAQSAGLGERFGPYLAGVETDALTRAGRLAEAAAVVTRARRSGDPDGRSLYLVTAQIRFEVLRGRRTAAEAAERAAVAIAADDIDFDQVAFLELARAELALLVGEDLRALEHARAGASALEGRDDRFVGPLVASVRARALGRLARTAHTSGDLEAATRWAREAASLVVGDRGTRGLAALADLVALERDRIEGVDRPAAWRGLARRWMMLEQPLRAADAWLREAEAWAFRGASRRRIADPLQRACDIAEASGAAALQGEIHTLARRCRVELDGAPQDDAAGALLRQDQAMELDPAERSILELLELGRPVSDVARTTGIPVTRVRSMLGELRARARVPSDAALLDAAARLGLTRVGPAATAARPRPERAERTFLFADIVGSTALLEAMGDDAWAGVRRWFDSTMRRAIAAHGGQEVDHTGDGFFVAFGSGAAGLACAVEMMRTLERQRRTSGFAPALRVGVHAGEARLDGDAYVGRTVHLAARLLGIAEAGEIVASGSVVAATGWPAVGPARSVLLKGVSEPVEVMSVRWAG